MPAVAEVRTNFGRIKQDVLDGLHWVADFTAMWVCCLGEDDDSVIENVRGIVLVHDHLAEEFVEFTHSPKQHHRSARPADIDVFENELPLTSQQQPVEIYENGHLVIEPLDPAMVVEVVIPQDDEPVDAAVVFQAHQPDEVEGNADRPVEDEELVEPAPTLVFTVCQDVVEVKNHRRVATNGRKFYESAVVSEIKNKLGLPKVTEANKLVVRRMAHNIMMKQGLRPTHIRQSIEKVVAGVFIPDRYDVESAKMLSSNVVADLREEVIEAGPRNGWSVICDWARFGLRRRGASRVPPVTGPP